LQPPTFRLIKPETRLERLQAGLGGWELAIVLEVAVRDDVNFAHHIECVDECGVCHCLFLSGRDSDDDEPGTAVTATHACRRIEQRPTTGTCVHGRIGASGPIQHSGTATTGTTRALRSRCASTTTTTGICDSTSEAERVGQARTTRATRCRCRCAACATRATTTTRGIGSGCLAVAAGIALALNTGGAVECAQSSLRIATATGSTWLRTTIQCSRSASATTDTDIQRYNR
jgi:hypothetical protein